MTPDYLKFKEHTENEYLSDALREHESSLFRFVEQNLNFNLPPKDHEDYPKRYWDQQAAWVAFGKEVYSILEAHLEARLDQDDISRKLKLIEADEAAKSAYEDSRMEGYRRAVNG